MPYHMVFKVDGGCRRNGQDDAIGAAACCLQRRWGSRYNYKKVHLPSYPTPTNQRAEITAIIMALKWTLQRFDELEGYPRLRVTIYSDSRYAVGCMTDWIDKWRENGWTNSRGLEVANRDLIEEASDLENRVLDIGFVSYVWVPRWENEAADRHCNEALDEQEKGNHYPNYSWLC